MKRPLTLTAFILGTVMHSIYTISSLVVVAALIDLMNAAGGSSAILAVTLILTLALSVVSLIFNALSISAWNKSPEGYRKKRGLIITAIVFNFVIVLLLIIGMASAPVGIIDILLMLSVIAANVLALVDLAREKNKVAKLQKAEAAAQPAEEIKDAE